MNCPNHVGNGVGPVGVGTAAPISASHAPRLYTFPAGIAPPPTEEERVWMDGCREGSLLQDNYKVVNAFGSYAQINHLPFQVSFVETREFRYESNQPSDPQGQQIEVDAQHCVRGQCTQAHFFINANDIWLYVKNTESNLTQKKY